MKTFGCPATVGQSIDGGPQVGARTLATGEQVALDLLASFTEAQRAKAVIAAKAPAEYRNAGDPKPPAGPAEGLPAADMTDDQRKACRAVLATYSANLAPELAAARLAEIKAAGTEKVCFAWAGATKPGVGHCFRVQGPTFVLDFVNVQPDPAGNVANHIHSVWRSLTQNFGVAAK